jgi:MinD-like ATPase involved in chromosome partitioning or flagellar assembly
MSTVVSVLTTKDGQGSTSFALSLAWAAAEQRRVLLVDADMSGTGTLADAIALDFGGLGIGNLFGTVAISAAMLEQQAVTVGVRPRLRVVAGLQGFSGPGAVDLLPRLVPALRSVPDDLVVLDLGAIAEASQRVFIVMHDSPARLVKSIQVLKAAQLPQAELVVYETRRGALREQMRRALAEHLPGVRIGTVLPWDERRAMRAEDAATPMVVPGLLQTLRLPAAGTLQEAVG